MKNQNITSIFLVGALTATTPLDTNAQIAPPNLIQCGVKINELQQNLKALVRGVHKQNQAGGNTLTCAFESGRIDPKNPSIRDYTIGCFDSNPEIISSSGKTALLSPTLGKVTFILNPDGSSQLKLEDNCK